MKKLILLLALSASFAVNASNRPIDGKMKHIKGVEAAQLAARLVELTGYRCDSISSFMPSIFNGRKLTLKCNHFRYVYTIEDKGCRWVVNVK